jgi:putative ABC transport system permease protein
MPADTQLLKLNLIEGRGLQTSDNDALVINDALAKREPQLKVGSTVMLQMGPAATAWRIVGITRETFSPAVAYAPLSFFSERHPGMVNSLRLALDKTDPDSIDLTKALLDQNLENEGIRARGSLSTADSRFGFDQHMLMIYVFLIIMSVIVGGVGTLGLMTTMSLNIMERRREIAVMRAIGATAGIVSLIVIVEGIAVGLMSWTIAAIAAWPVSRGLGKLMVRLLFTNGLHFKFEWWGLLIWLGVSLLASLFATLVPAWKTSRTTIREGLAYE